MGRDMEDTPWLDVSANGAHQAAGPTLHLDVNSGSRPGKILKDIFSLGILLWVDWIWGEDCSLGIHGKQRVWVHPVQTRVLSSRKACQDPWASSACPLPGRPHTQQEPWELDRYVWNPETRECELTALCPTFGSLFLIPPLENYSTVIKRSHGKVQISNFSKKCITVNFIWLP